MAHAQLTKELNIDFISKRKIAAMGSGALMVVFLLSILVRGFNFGLDFTGGTVIEVGYQQPAELAGVTQALADEGFNDAVVQYFGSRQDVLIRLAPRDEDVASAELSDQVLRILTQQAGEDVELRRVEFVGPQVGEELREQGGLAVLFSLIGILIYVALRFEWRFAAGAVVAIIHDVVFTIGLFSIFAIPFDLTVLAAVLAVIGYSLNDTIVIFDRIRENFRKMRKGTVIEIANRSINQTLSRTIVTSGTTLLVLLALYFLGGAAISGFSIALIIGVVVGTYSTIFIATAMAIWLGISRTDLLPAVKEGELLDDRP
ncbi:protein translocase subunit SecF [Rhabdochromatium marinum]|uniref:protein translocase subunit SecF n=1 Tax=Rhabdochromatium marinum TaxID=48729 RepID=UPI0019067D5F|nr:protein translocase subunit SecF [Rhabdochromatium marinum]MBK1648482.1 protein translocase subunit SecF [Rhabdochromatium marinum]